MCHKMISMWWTVHHQRFWLNLADSSNLIKHPRNIKYAIKLQVCRRLPAENWRQFEQYGPLYAKQKRKRKISKSNQEYQRKIANIKENNSFFFDFYRCEMVKKTEGHNCNVTVQRGDCQQEWSQKGMTTQMSDLAKEWSVQSDCLMERPPKRNLTVDSEVHIF